MEAHPLKPSRKKLTRAEQKAQRPGQILDAAFEEFIEKGFSATRVEDIAERIGVTKGTIYVYFPTKEELFSAMIRHISVPFEDILADAGKLKGTCSEQLQALIVLSYERLVGDRKTRELLRFVISEGARFPEVIDAHHSEIIEPVFARTQAILDEGIRLGEFRATPGALAALIVAPLMSVTMEQLVFGDRKVFDMPAYMKGHVDLVLNGLAVVPA